MTWYAFTAAPAALVFADEWSILQAQLSVDKQALVGHGRIENRQAFVTVPTLEELRYLLIIIVEEITRYQVWPVRPLR